MYMSSIMRKSAFCICGNKDTDQLCSNCAADQRLCFHYIVQMFIPLLLNPKFQASSLLLWLYHTVCVGLGGNPEDRFSHKAAHMQLLLNTGEDKIIRECESNLMKSAYHRLRMPVLRRHGYCLKARHNDFWNPRQMEDQNMEYCFCNDWNGCNGAPAVHSRLLLPVFSIFTLLAYTLKHFIL